MSSAKDHQSRQLSVVVDRYAPVFCWLLQRLARSIAAQAQDSHQKGMAWQSRFAEMAVARGLVVEKGEGRADWVVSGKKVQCKNIDAVRGGMIDISNMRPVKSNGGHRGYLAHELDVLALLHLSQVYLIPRSSICDDQGVINGRVRPEFIKQFHENWAAFDCEYVPPRRDRQQTFLGRD